MNGRAAGIGPAPPGAGRRARPGRWRADFPYHWDADDLVSRRELLRFAVLTSGTLFLGTTLLGVLGWLDNRRRGQPKVVAQASQVPEGRAVYFEYPERDEQGMLIHLPGGDFVAYSQKCTHLSCAVYYQEAEERLYCPCHEGIFDVRTGEPLAGPPQRRLPRITLHREGDALIAVEEVP